SASLGICKNCIEKEFEKSKPFIEKAHSIRRFYGLPTFPPKSKGGIKCSICGNECKLENEEIGFCGLTQNKEGKLIRKIGNEKFGLISWYKDWHPTNCVAVNWCAGGTGAGYPKYAKKPTTEYGYANASIFCGTCSYHCLFCQNTSWHDMVRFKNEIMEARKLANSILKDETYTCVCWFGGDPSCQAPFVWSVSHKLRKEAKRNGRILRICLETNGNFSWYWLKKIAKICFESGGGIKFDLKFPKGSNCNVALCGVGNEKSYKNFEKLVDLHKRRQEVPFLRASTLLIPHYISIRDIERIAKFIVSLDESIPYSLLAFFPHYRMSDMGLTTTRFAQECLRLCKKIGLKRVRIGNLHLLV
ncbi:MAG TPA: radical SAM protein, partial [Candidatus Aenigmarchaeota archaeon]|nr:radical SAM protein [Candidatus Aenigmarchaeota archaeon]